MMVGWQSQWIDDRKPIRVYWDGVREDCCGGGGGSCGADGVGVGVWGRSFVVVIMVVLGTMVVGW